MFAQQKYRKCGQTHRSAPTGAENKRQKIIQDMKKTYVSPLMVEVNVEAEQMLAASLGINNDESKSVDTSISGNQLGKDNGREW